ncbi:MAG: LemA family protein [Ignavibacteriae bacterium]|nr:LemA family protein [Ignavibacteriota bacterium]
MKSRGCLIAGGIVGAIVLVLVILVGWGMQVYNGLVTKDESVRSAWSQVETQYQRRMDLIPNLVSTVQGFAKQEVAVFQGVADARSRVGQITVTKEVLEDPQAFAKFQQAQDQLSGALSRLLAVSENYPQLKSNENFMALQSQLEGTENRITWARSQFNEQVQDFNTTVRRFPASMLAGMFGFKEKAYFAAKAGAEDAPKVQF